MVKVIERATGTEYKANRIEGGYEIFTLSGEKYKKLKESTFKKYFKLTGEKATTKEEPKLETPKTEKSSKKQENKVKKSPEVKKELSPEGKEAMIAKIKKIFNLSKNNPSQEEGIAAALKAQKLMSEYNIHEDEVTLEEVDPNEIVAMATELKHNSSLHTWRKALGSVIAQNFRVKCYTDQYKDTVFRGFKEDVEIAKEVYTYLYILGDKLGSKAYHEALTKGSGKGVYNSFVLGFLKGVEDALGEQCVALMVVTPKAVEEEYEKFSAENLKTSKVSLKGQKNETYEKGRQEGKAAVKSKQLSKKGDK